VSASYNLIGDENSFSDSSSTRYATYDGWGEWFRTLSGSPGIPDGAFQAELRHRVGHPIL
jgi:hypothetical protein